MRTAVAFMLVTVIASRGEAPRDVPAAAASSKPEPARVVANDNRRPAGMLRDGKLELKLEIVSGRWFPEADDGTSAVVPAFAEVGRAPEIPGPLVRVPEGTTLHITIHNVLPKSEIFLHGLHTRPATADDLIRIPGGQTKEVTFVAGAPGTYFYWASVGRQTMVERMLGDAALSGAIVVDPSSGQKSDERIFVINVWRTERDSAGYSLPHAREIVSVNGKSWPYTERFTFNQGDTVSWRWINTSSAPHPMHLHGFYYDVERHGTEAADTLAPPTEISRVNTRLLVPGTTMKLHFVTERPGNWLFHCHLAAHFEGTAKLKYLLNQTSLAEMAREDGMHGHHGLEGMAGLIIGMHVLPKGPQPTASTLEPQRVRLVVQTSPRGNPERPAYGFAMQQGAEPAPDSVALPGPTIFLEKGRPARINVVNHLKKETAVHWHGMEIESFPDGVPGWSGTPARTFTSIAPNDSFIAAFTPPRAGTFIYHSHLDELTQTNSGMYGALIVTDSTHVWNSEVDKLIVIGANGPGSVEFRPPGLINGSTTPSLELEAGKTYRLHIVQIHPQALVNIRVGTDTTTARWTPIAKDGADLPTAQSTPRAAVVLMGAGETADFLFTPERPGAMRMDIRTRIAGWWVPVQLLVRPAR